MSISNFSRYFSFVVFYLCVAASFYDPRISIFALMWLFTSLIPVFTKNGRYWCGKLCPRGVFYDKFLKRISPGKIPPAWFKNPASRTVLVTLFLAVLLFGLYRSTDNPWNFSHYTFLMLLFLSIADIIMAFQYSERTWCHICPMGTIAVGITKFRGIDHSEHKENYSETAVKSKCPMGLSTYKDADCIFCDKCANQNRHHN